MQDAYDPLSRLIAFKRGELTASGNNGAVLDEVDTPTREQDWDLDQLGNWDEIETDSTAQDRDHNAQNEITSISGTGAVQPTYDHNGNTTTFPAAMKDDFGVEVRAVFDAWNRLVKLLDDQDQTLAEYAYDALHRRIVRKEFDGGTLDATFHDYFTPAWQLAEVRQDGLSGDGVLEHYLWDAAPAGYIDCLVLRDRDTDDDGTLDERLYAQQDAIYNVSAILDTSGDVEERYLFDPYGTRSFLDPDFDPRAASDFAWRVGSQGLVHDLDGSGAGLIYTRFRFRHSTLGRWVTRDPLGYLDGMSLYPFASGAPTSSTDFMGHMGRRTHSQEPAWRNAQDRTRREQEIYERASSDLSDADLAKLGMEYSLARIEMQSHEEAVAAKKKEDRRRRQLETSRLPPGLRPPSSKQVYYWQVLDCCRLFLLQAGIEVALGELKLKLLASEIPLVVSGPVETPKGDLRPLLDLYSQVSPAHQALLVGQIRMFERALRNIYMEIEQKGCRDLWD